MSAEPMGARTLSDAPEWVVRPQGRLRRAATRLFRFAVGVVLTQFFLGAIIVAGWVRRRMQRASYEQWWRIAGRPEDEAAFLRALASADPVLAIRAFPRWCWHEQPRAHMFRHRQPGGRGAVAGALGAAGHSLWLNARGGCSLLLHTFVITLPATVLWAFSWRYGWDNSFGFGYEQAAIGPALGLMGVAWFMVTMLYLPMAQARMASADNWRAFYDVRLVLMLMRRNWVALLLLAALYFVLALPLLGLKVIIPYSLASYPGIESLTNAEVAALLNTRYLAMGAVGLFAYLVVHLRAARIYAAAVAAAVRDGEITPYQLAPCERTVFARFGLLEAAEAIPAPPARRQLRTALGRVAIAGGVAVALIIWFGVVAQIYVGQFMQYVPLRGWLNQPMIHAPHFNYTPRYLSQGEGEPPLPDAVFK